jgi:hypothetical protein
MPGTGPAAYPAAVSANPVTSPSLGELRAARAQQQLVVRAMRPFGWLVLILGAVCAFRSHQSPGFTGPHLAVSFALAGFLLGGIGSVAARFRPVPLVSEARLAVYRVAQEAPTNISRHAQPAQVVMHLAYEPATTRLTVEDYALPSGMRERAEVLGGMLTTEATGTGDRVNLEVPA